MTHDPNDRGFKLLGDVLRAQNKRDEAVAAYEKSLQLNSQQEDVLSLVCDLIPPDISNCERLAVRTLLRQRQDIPLTVVAVVGDTRCSRRLPRSRRQVPTQHRGVEGCLLSLGFQTESAPQEHHCE